MLNISRIIQCKSTTSDVTVVFCHCLSQDFQICSSITLSEY
ncbi:hypothetical protein T4A_12124 [Trichinella pseudospiralis]|uniref:Uncharacterized protein n=1 Tax=Trichinella pseudospiralis TaxID=6337 RepID=A0A0V1DKK7_TRIPS|nr:hypothetical protein T4A_2724 [Trichinella pseudospiralis]KRY61666.1 hypothetical protein T4A_12124 [Trichinella pseudospiralis]